MTKLHILDRYKKVTTKIRNVKVFDIPKRAICATLALLLSTICAVGQGVPYFPQTLPAGTVIGRLPSGAGPTQAIPFSLFISQALQAPIIGPLTIDLNPTTLQPPPAGTIIQVGQNNGLAGNIGIDVFINGQSNVFPRFYGRSIQGTAALGSASLSGDVLIDIAGRGFNSQSYSNDQALMEAVASENWTTSAEGTYWVWQTTQAGGFTTPTERMRLNDSGLNIGVVGARTGVLNLNGATSGTASITAQAAAGTPTLTLGTNSGTPAVTASTPLAITTATGNATCTTCAVTTSGLSQFGSNTSTSAQVAALLSDETGFNVTGNLVFNNSPSIPTINGGSAVSSTLTLQSTSAAGTSDSVSINTGSQIPALVFNTNHHLTTGTQTAPTTTGCNSGAFFTGSTDFAGRIQTGATTTACNITFNKAYTNTPFCLVQSTTQLAAFSYTVSTTAINVTQTSTSNNLIIYICIAPNGG